MRTFFYLNHSINPPKDGISSKRIPSLFEKEGNLSKGYPLKISKSPDFLMFGLFYSL